MEQIFNRAAGKGAIYFESSFGKAIGFALK